MSFKLVSSILRGKWLLNPAWAHSQIPLVASLLKGDTVNFKADYYAPDQQPDKPHTTTNDNIIENNFIGVVNICGPITKSDGACGEPGSITLANQFRELNNNPDVKAILLVIDSPGGEVDGTQTFADAVKEKTKPVIAFVNDGMMCSAAYWMGCNADEIYASHDTCNIGSIGVYCTLVDYISALEAQGVKVHEIYSNLSTEKNIDYRNAMKGDYDGIKTELDFIAEKFIAAVKTAQPNINPEVFKGNTYNAIQATALGLITGTASFSDVLARINVVSQKNTNTMFRKKLSKLADLKGKQVADISAEEITAINAEVKEAGVEGVLVVKADFVAQQENLINAADTKLAQADEKLAEFDALKASVAELSAKATELEATNKELSEKLSTYGNLPGGVAAAPLKDADKIEVVENEYLTSVDREAAELRAKYK